MASKVKAVPLLLFAVALGGVVVAAKKCDSSSSNRRSSRFTAIDRLQQSLKNLQQRIAVPTVDLSKIFGKAAKNLSGPTPAPPPPPPPDPIQEARKACTSYRTLCYPAVRGLAARQPRDEATTKALAELLPKALNELEWQGMRRTVRQMQEVSAEVGNTPDRVALETRLQRSALRDMRDGGYAWLEPSIHGDRVARARWGRHKIQNAEALTGPDGRRWMRSTYDRETIYFLASALERQVHRDYSEWVIAEPSFADIYDLMSQSEVPFWDAFAIWWDPVWRNLKGFLALPALFMILATIFAPRWGGRLLWRLGLRRLGFYWFAFGAWRAARSPVTVRWGRIGPIIDYARAVDWRVRRRLRAERRRRLLETAAARLESCAPYSPRAQAWLARLLRLLGRTADAGHAAREALGSRRPPALARIELATLAVDAGEVAHAEMHLGYVRFPRTLTAEVMRLKAIVAAHAGRYAQARRWLFWARRRREVRRTTDLLVAALRETRGDLSGARRAARRAARRGSTAAAVWLVREARHRGDFAAALEIVKKRGRGAPGMRLEEELLRVRDPESHVAIARSYPDSLDALRAAFRAAAAHGLRSAYLDARVEAVPAALREASGDYAYGVGDRRRALRAWRAAAEADPSFVPVLERRARALIADALAAGDIEEATALARIVRVGGALETEVALRGVDAALEAAREARPATAPVATPPGAASALYHVLRRDTELARAAAEGASNLDAATKETLLGLLAPGATARPEVAAAYDAPSTWRVNARTRHLSKEVERCREALRQRRFAELREGISALRTWLPDDLEAVRQLEATIEAATGALPSLDALALVRETYPDPVVRALAVHDRAVRLAAERSDEEGWGRWVAAWNLTFGSTAYEAYLRRRVLELGDARLGTDAVEAALGEAEGALAEELEGFVEARLDRKEGLPKWLSSSRLGARALRELAEAAAKTVEQQIERAEPRVAKVSPEEIWREEVAVMLRALARLSAMEAMPERRTSLQEWACRMLINLGVDANAVGSYSLAIAITSEAGRQARSPLQQELCAGNLNVYTNNLARNLRPPGRK